MQPIVAIATSTDVLGRWPAAAADRDRSTPAVRRFLTEVDQDDAVAARLLCRELLGQVGGAALAETALQQTCGDCGGPHGRPVVSVDRSVGVSWSHSHGLVMAGVFPDGGVGVDIERRTAPTRLDDAFRRRMLAPAEQRVVVGAAEPTLAALQLWTGKEALVKLGAAGAEPLATVDLSELVPASTVIWRDCRVTSRSSDDFAAAIATRTR